MTVFLIQAIDSSWLGTYIKGLMWLSQEDMDYLYYRTVDRLSNFRPTTRLLVQDLQLLCMLWPQNSSVFRLHLAAILAV